MHYNSITWLLYHFAQCNTQSHLLYCLIYSMSKGQTPWDPDYKLFYVVISQDHHIKHTQENIYIQVTCMKNNRMEVNWVWEGKVFSDQSIMNTCNLVPTSVKMALKGSTSSCSPGHNSKLGGLGGMDGFSLKWGDGLKSTTTGLVLQVGSESKQLDHNVLHKPEKEGPLRGEIRLHTHSCKGSSSYIKEKIKLPGHSLYTTP